MASPTDALVEELQAPLRLRRFGSGWYAGFFGLVLAIAGFGMVLVLRYPDWLGSPELAAVRESSTFRPVVHVTILAAYALSVISLMLRSRKVLGFTALAVALA